MSGIARLAAWPYLAVYSRMEIEFDDAKDAANRLKHGVPLALGAVALESLIGETLDDRRDYGETRINAFGLIAGRLYVCTYTKRGPVYRIISLRKASRREQGLWQP
ncbi:MAG: BrnT family toxin [Rhodospirillales bacterium]|nr:BrnT family toxin [Rhodospirillales bacterium]